MAISRVLIAHEQRWPNFKTPITVEDVLNSRLIAYQLN
jgi:hypothetical protein